MWNVWKWDEVEETWILWQSFTEYITAEQKAFARFKSEGRWITCLADGPRDRRISQYRYMKTV